MLGVTTITEQLFDNPTPKKVGLLIQYVYFELEK
jgi:hypothetical protein